MNGFIKLEDLFKRSKRNPYLGQTEKLNGIFTKKPFGRFVGAGYLFCAAVLASSCQDDVDVNVAKNDTPKELQIEVINEGISDQETKGLITGTTFPANSEITLTVTGPNTVTYGGKTYTATSTSILMAKATKYNCTFTMDSKTMSITSVSVTDWSGSTNTELRPNC